MSITNVSTFGSLQNLLQNMSNVQNSLNNDQTQLSSGDKSQTFDGISSGVEQLTSVNAQIARLSGYTQGNTGIIAQMNVTNTLLGQIGQLATNMKNLVANQVSGTSSNGAFVQQMNSQMSSLVSLLNSTYGSNYLFGGTDLTSPPVKTPVPPPDQVGVVPDANYYQGTNQDMTFRVSDSQTINPNVRANDMAFQNLFAGIRQAISTASGTAADSGALKNAEDLIDQGIQGVNELQSTVNSNILTVQQINTQNQSVQTYFKGIVSNISSTDVVAVSAQVAQDTSILQASFSTFARISQLTLSNYLK